MITEHRVSIDGVETSYCENGAGRPIVFLHGAGFGAEGKSSFVRQLNGLSDQFRVVAIDHLHAMRMDCQLLTPERSSLTCPVASLSRLNTGNRHPGASRLVTLLCRVPADPGRRRSSARVAFPARFQPLHRSAVLVPSGRLILV
jgi:hypothetical protein